MTISSSMDLQALSLIFVTLFFHLLAIQSEPAPPVSSRIVVMGAVYCDTCFNNGFSRYSYFIPGVDVHIQCRISADEPKTAEMITFSVNRTTNKYGVYKLEIPSVDGVDCIDGPPIQSSCQATLLGSSSTACDVPSLKTTTDAISVKSKQKNLCVYSFTSLSFRPRNRDTTLCGKQVDESQSAGSTKFIFPHEYSFETQETASKVIQGLPPK